MGGRNSKNSNGRSSKKYSNPYANTNSNRNFESHHDLQPDRTETGKLSVAPQVTQKLEKVQAKDEAVVEEASASLVEGYASSEDEFYDGIPRFRRSSLPKSRSRRAKVSEVSSLLGKAGSAGLERAVEVLDTLGSTMTSLNPNGFVSGVTAKNNELSILSFEVANTIVKGSNIMQSLSRRSIRILKEVVLPSEGVQQLVSTDIDELLKIVATDKREELRVFAGEIVRFGNRCKDPQWHNLDRFFEKHGRERTPQKQLQNEAGSLMQQLMVFVQHTAELYQELHRLDKYDQEYQLKRLEDRTTNPNQRGNSLTIMAADIKAQRKLVRSLKKKSLWSRSLEEVMEKLVDIVLFLNREINNVFGNKDDDDDAIEEKSSRLGPSGLALHYANIILLIDSIVSRASSIPPNARDTLYQSLPPNIKSSFRSKLHSFRVKEELSITEIKAEMGRTLQWLVPVAINTAKAHHGFGWVGEWASPGSESGRQTVGPINVMQIETLHHADRQKTEAHIHELLLWLNCLVSRSQIGVVKGENVKPSLRTPVGTDQQNVPNCPSPTLTNKDEKMQQDVSNKVQVIQEISATHNFDPEQGSNKLNKNSSYSASSESPEKMVPVEKSQSSLPTTDFGISNEQKLNIIDRVDINK